MKTKYLTLAILLFLTISLTFTKNCFSQTSEDSKFGIFGAYSPEYGWFQNQMGFTNADYWNWVDGHFQNLGAHWTRSNIQLAWDLIEPDLDSIFNWNINTYPDNVINRIYTSPADVNWLGCVYIGPARNPLDYPNNWQNFLKAVVERYNGDGINDLNSSVKVTYWQLGNEISELLQGNITSSDYAQIVALSESAIHAVDSSAKICLVAPNISFAADTFLVNVITQLSVMGVPIDIIDLHHWESATNYRFPALAQFRNILDNNGYNNVKIWSCENGTWVYQPANSTYQTQQEQAASLIKRYVWGLANGIDKLFWNNLMEWYAFYNDTGSVYNSMGLVGDGTWNQEPANEFNFKRKSYYSYKFLASTIDTYYATFVSTNSFHNEFAGNFGYSYQKTSTNDNFDIFWTDNDSAVYNFNIIENHQLSEMVPFDDSGSFNTQNFSAGLHTVTLYKNQVYLLQKSSTLNIQNKLLAENMLHISPNPSSGKFNINIVNMSMSQIEIYDFLGNIIYKSVITTPKSEIDLSTQPKGIYFYRVTNNKNIIGTGKIIIQ